MTKSINPCNANFQFRTQKWYEKLDLVFNVKIDPFRKEALIIATYKGVGMAQKIWFEELDEWNSFEYLGYKFDIHFLYDQGFSVAIYPVENEIADYSHNFKVVLSYQENSLINS